MRLACLLALLLVFAPEAVAQSPTAGEIVINEIAYDPPAPQASTNEWIEVINRGSRTVDLAGVFLSDASSSSDPIPGPLALAPGEYAVLVRNASEFTTAYPGITFVELTSFPSLNNSGDDLALEIGTTRLDFVPYLSSWGGTDASLERRDPDGPSGDPDNWATTTDASGGTPGARNTVFETDTTPPTVDLVSAQSATELVVQFSEPVTLASAENTMAYEVSDGIGEPTFAELMDDDQTARLTLGTPLPGLGTYTLTARGISDRAGNVLTEGSFTFGFGEGDTPEAFDLVINEFLYDEPATDNPGEFVELFNRTDKTFDLSDFTLNDGTGDDQPVTEEQVLVEPGGYAVIVEDASLFAAIFPGVPFVEQPSWSALNNSGDAIILKYEGATIDELVYSPGWGGEDASLERKDPDGPSSVAINWETTLDLRGGTPGEINSQFEPDVTGPAPLAVEVDASETQLTVTLSEPLAPGTLTPSSFSITGGPGIASVDLSSDGTVVTLGLDSRLPTGTFTLVARDLQDLLGNVTPEATFDFGFEADTIAPSISRASATSATSLQIDFTEAITPASASDLAAYTIDGQPAPTSVQTIEDRPGAVIGIVLSVGTPFPERQVLTVRASGLTDLAGNVRDETRATFFFGTADTPLAGEIAITEIMFDPQTGSDGEYVELHNLTSDRLFDLRTLVLDDALDGSSSITDVPSILAPGEFLAVVKDVETFRLNFPEAPAVQAESFPGLGNSGDLVALLASGVVIDSVRYDPDWHRVELDDATGISLERRDPAIAPNDPGNWSSSLDARGGTPSDANSIGSAPGPPPEASGLAFSPNPFDAGSGDAVQIAYSLEAEASLVRVRVFDGGGRVVRELEQARLTGREGIVLWDGRDDRGEQLRIGPYIVLLEAVDVEGGTTEAYRGVVVLARQL